MGVKWVWTVPNVLSLFRIVLIPVFAALYILSAQQPVLLPWSVGVLAVSGLTDLLDGLIARKFHQISEIGKLLDPIADKLTQVAVLVCMAVHLPRLWPLVGLCFVKESLQAVGVGLLLFRQKSAVQAARWYGKVSTFVFYFAMALFVIFPPEPHEPLLLGWHMPVWMFVALAAVVAVCMIYAFVQYARIYAKILKESKESMQTAE